MGEIEWIEPPPSARGGRYTPSRWPGIVDELRAHPGAWARVVVDGWLSTGTQLRRGQVVSLCPPEIAVEDRAEWVRTHLEVATRRAQGNRCDIYMRWIGPTP